MWKVVTKNDDGWAAWATGHDLPRLIQFTQYVVDSCSNPEHFYIHDMTTKKELRLDKFAEYHGIKKRTLEERLNSKI